MKKHRLAVFAAVILLTAAILPLAVSAVSLPEPSEIFYVLDSSGVLETDTVNYIVDKNDRLNENTGAQIVVVTVDFVPNGDLEQYCYNLFNEWKIGSKEKSNGVLLLLSIGDDDYFCMQGTGLEKTLPSGTIGDILEKYLEPDFAAQDYNSGVRKVFDQLYDRVSSLYGYKDKDTSSQSGAVTVQPDYQSGNQTSSQTTNGSDFSTILIMAVIVIVIVIASIPSKLTRSFAGGNSNGCLGCLFGWMLLGSNNHRGGPRGGFGGPPRGGRGGFGGNHGGSFGGSRGGSHGGGFGGGGGSSHGGSRGGGGGSSRGGGAGRR